MIDIDYEQYAILRVSHLWQGREFHVLKYFSKLLPRCGLGGCPPGDHPAQSPVSPQLGASRASMNRASGGSGS